ncbi:MAG: pilus assembly PilX N-terminal domain-containing protein [Acidimicrobiia bacterium]|nr:pilus assembly PilX N-terminal domain-containing protein [Acidimicrobiia bacterium]
MNRLRSIRSRDPETGSAFIITLLALIVLSIVALSLTVITQTELQIATNELTSQRAFYSSDSGIDLAIARVLTVGSSVEDTTVTSTSPMRFVVPEPPLAGVKRAQVVEVTPFVPLRDSFCDGCPAGMGDVQLKNVNHAVATSAQRVVWMSADEMPPDDARRFAQKRLYTQVGIQPWFPPEWESIADEEQLSQVTQDPFGTYPD